MAKVREAVRVCRNTPLVAPRIPSSGQNDNPLDPCVLDTGCPFPLVVSPGIAARMPQMADYFPADIILADGSSRHVKVCLGEVYWLSDTLQLVSVRVMDPCPDSLLGFPLVKRAKIVLDAATKTGYVESL